MNIIAEIRKLGKINTPNKSVNQIIEEIHETFYTEVDKLLKEANISHSLETDKSALIDKCKRLKAMGFSNTKEVVEAEAEIVRLEKLKKENVSKKELIEAINYFSFKYPNYKFITEESVKRICQKYNLIYGNSTKYIGTIPDNNLKHIEDFSIKPEDEMYLRIREYLGMGRSRNDIKVLKYSEYIAEKDYVEPRGNYRISYVRDNYIKAPLEIAAPIKDFNTTGMEVKDYQLSKIEVPDPVVLKPVMFNSTKYYLIVTAWGLEASDINVINEKMN